MRRLFMLLLLLPLAACEKGQPFDGASFFDSITAAGAQAARNTYLESAQSAEKKGDYRGAAEYYEKVIRTTPDDPDVQFLLAESYRKSGDPARALAIYDRLIASEQNVLSATEAKGLALMAKGDYRAPTLLFEQVLQADPTRWKTLNALGVLFATRELYEEAGQYFQAALQQSPGNAAILNNLALSQALTQNYATAIHNLSHAATLTPANTPERKHIDLNLALAYAADGNVDDAQRIAAPHVPSDMQEYNMAIYSHVASDRQLADDYLHMALTEGKRVHDKAREAAKAAKLAEKETAVAQEPVEPVIVTPHPSSVPPALRIDTKKQPPVAKKPSPRKVVKKKTAPKEKVAEKKPVPKPQKKEVVEKKPDRESESREQKVAQPAKALDELSPSAQQAEPQEEAKSKLDAALLNIIGAED